MKEVERTVKVTGGQAEYSIAEIGKNTIVLKREKFIEQFMKKYPNIKVEIIYKLRSVKILSCYEFKYMIIERFYENSLGENIQSENLQEDILLSFIMR